jgi:tetratricopeptide (TPR) repeat protein
MRRLACLLLAALALAGCKRNEPREEPRCDCADTERVVDPALLAFLSQARSAHHVADAKEATGDREGAIAALLRLTTAARPHGSAPEVDEVLADTRARLADLLSQSERFEQAEAQIVQGLEHARTPTYFRGHLFEVRGLLEERQEKALRVKGRGQEADQARDRSLSAYEEAMKVQAGVIQGAVPSARPEPAVAPSSTK